MTKGLKEGELLLYKTNYEFTNPKLVNKQGKLEAEFALIARPTPALKRERWQVAIYNNTNKKRKEKSLKPMDTAQDRQTTCAVQRRYGGTQPIGDGKTLAGQRLFWRNNFLGYTNKRQKGDTQLRHHYQRPIFRQGYIANQ